MISAMDQMNSTDVSFLNIENDFNHMHIAAVAVFEGPTPAGDEIERMIASKLDEIPRYRQKLQFVPFDLGRPIWTDDAHFDLSYHVRHTALPSPGKDEQLRTLVGRVMSQRLDRSRPLWETWVVEGLEGERWALISKSHHCMVDGVSGADLLAVMLDAVSDADPPSSTSDWKPERPPSKASLLMDSFTEGIRKPAAGFDNLRRLIGTPRRALRELADLSDALSTFRTSPSLELESALNGPIGPHRRWCHGSMTFTDIKKIRKRHGGTVNDVVLAAVAHGFQTLLQSRGVPTRDRFVRTLVPVSIRRDEEKGQMNNRVATVFAELPIGLDDPAERLAAVRAEMDSLKEHHQSEVSELFGAITEFTPPVLLAAVSRMLANLDQQTIQTVTTNVPGPRHTLYAAGRRLAAVYPYVPLCGSIRIGVAIFSYAGTIHIGITGDYETTADIDVLRVGIEAGIDALLSVS